MTRASKAAASRVVTQRPLNSPPTQDVADVGLKSLCKRVTGGVAITWAGMNGNRSVTHDRSSTRSKVSASLRPDQCGDLMLKSLLITGGFDTGTSKFLQFAIATISLCVVDHIMPAQAPSATPTLETLPPITAGDSLADQVYSALRSATRRGILTPGQKVTERQLAQQFDVSPTPVREALRQLVHEKLFERTGPKSLRVADYEREDRREIAEAEAVLCGLTARLTTRKADASLIAELEAILAESDLIVERLLARESPSREEDTARVLALMRRFHHRIETSTGNTVIEGLLQQSRAFTDDERKHRTLLSMDRDASSTKQRYRQHREILQALKAGDENLCERITVKHHLEALEFLSST